MRTRLPLAQANGWACAILIGAAFTVSLFFSGGTSWLYAPALLLLLAAMLVAILPSLAGRDITLPRGAPVFALLAFFAWLTISLFWSRAPFASLVTWLVLCSLPVTFFTLTVAPGGRDLVENAYIILQALLALLGLSGIVQAVVLGGRVAYPFLDANNFAALMALGAVPALAATLTLPTRAMPRVTAGVFLLTFGGLLATESRGGLLCFLIAAAPMLFLVRQGIEKRRVLPLAAMAAAMGLALALFAEGGGTAARLAAMVAGDEAVLNRPVLWRATLGMIAEAPLTGSGLGSFYLAYPSHRPLADTVSAGQWAHNDILQLAADTGVAGALLLALFIATLLRRQARLRSDDARARALTAGPFFGFLGVLLHGQIECQLYVMPILIAAGVWLAVWHHRGAAMLPPEQSWTTISLAGWRKTLPTGLALVIAILLAVPAMRGGAGQYYLNQAVAAIGENKPQRFNALLDRAEQYAPSSFIDAKIQRSALYIDLLRTPVGLFTRADQDIMARYVQTTLDLAEGVMPLWSAINDRRAAFYSAMGPRLGPDWATRAENEWLAALRKNPLDITARARLITAAMNRGDAETADTLLTEGLQRPHPTAEHANMLALHERLQSAIVLKKQYQDARP